MSGLFSTFDPSSSTLMSNWISILLPLVVFTPSKWISKSQLALVTTRMKSSMLGDLNNNLKPFSFPGLGWFLTALLLLIFALNLTGLIPEVFTPTSHLVLPLTLALPLWGAYFVGTMILHPQSSLAHLVPAGSPAPLAPFMVLIELTSNCIRPVALAVRLMANMTAGHLIITLISSPLCHMSLMVSLIIILGPLLCLLSLELAVAFIQSYVFAALTSLFIKDVNNLKMDHFLITPFSKNSSKQNN